MEGSFQIDSDLYNRIFIEAPFNPELVVDYAVWNRIFASLPPSYRLPDEELLTLTKF